MTHAFRFDRLPRPEAALSRDRAKCYALRIAIFHGRQHE